MATSIAVLGAGHIGGNLARLLAAAGAVDEALALVAKLRGTPPSGRGRP